MPNGKVIWTDDAIRTRLEGSVIEFIGEAERAVGFKQRRILVKCRSASAQCYGPRIVFLGRVLARPSLCFGCEGVSRITSLEHKAELRRKFRNSDRYREWDKKYKKSPVGRASRRRWFNKKYETDPVHRVTTLARNRINKAIRRGCKTASTRELLGCDGDELRAHLEALWQPGMNWDNYGFGPGKWVVDHVRPISSFDLSTHEGQRAAFHYTNLQPLGWKENNRKGAKFSPSK